MNALNKILARIVSGFRAAGRFLVPVTGPVGRFVLRVTRPVGRFFARVVRAVAGLVGRRPVVALVVLGVVVVGLAVGVGLLWNSDRGHDNEADAREDAVAAAKESVPKLLSYDFDTVDKQLENVDGLLADPFKDEYTKFFTDNVVSTAKQQQIRTQTVVAAESVIDGDEKKVVALLFLNQETHSTAGPDPILTGSRIRITLEKDGGDWLISELNPV